MTDYIVATKKSWNVKNFETRTPHFDGKWHLITNPDDLTAEAISKINPRYIFFPHWSEIVPKEIFEVYECVCFHMTDVPHGRGGSPLQNLIVRGHKDTMLTALQMTQELDAGPIYDKTHLSLEGTAAEILTRASKASFDLIEKIITTQPTPTPQEGDVVKFSRRTPDMSVLSGQSSLVELYDHIRMLDAEGYPNAFIEHEDFILHFTDAQLDADTLKCSVTITEKEKKL